MKNLQIKLFKYKKKFIFLPFCLLILSGCGNDLNYSINTNIVAGLDGNKSLSFLTKISDLFLNYPSSFAKDHKVKNLEELIIELYKSLNPNDLIDKDTLKSLILNKDDQGIPYRFLFDHYDSIYFYVDGTGSFINCDPSIDGVKYCVGYGGAIKIKKGDEYFWCYFNDILNEKEDQIDKITEITKIIKV